MFLLLICFRCKCGHLMLRVTNTGRSAAKDVLIKIKRIENNGDRNELELDALFGKEIELN